MFFGSVRDGRMKRNSWGEIAHDFLRGIAEHFHHVVLDDFVIMPNHIHGILFLRAGNAGTACCAPTEGQRAGTACCAPTDRAPPRRFRQLDAGSLSVIVRSYKSAVTREIRRLRGTPSFAIWQGNFYEHIIRSERELADLRRYIGENPLKWSLDRENPTVKESDDYLPWEAPVKRAPWSEDT